MQSDCTGGMTRLKLHQQPSGLEAIRRAEEVLQSHHAFIDSGFGQRHDPHDSFGVVMGVDETQAKFVCLTELHQPLFENAFR